MSTTKMLRDCPDTSTIEGRALVELRIAYRAYLREGPEGYRWAGWEDRHHAESLAYVISGRSGFQLWSLEPPDEP